MVFSFDIMLIYVFPEYDNFPANPVGGRNGWNSG